MPTLTQKIIGLPSAPGERKIEFERALKEAAVAVSEALHRYCDCYRYTGSVIVGRRLAEMGIPDHVCAAAEIVCEIADEEGIDPRLCPVEGSIDPEHVAAVLGWLKITGSNLPERWLDQFAWRENETWFIHPELVPLAKGAGLRAEQPRRCYSFKRLPHELPIDPPANALLFKTRVSACPVVCVVNGIAHADPVNVLPEHLRATVPLCGNEWTRLTLAGIAIEVRATGGDGLFMGVAVDTGQMMRFNWEAGRSAFHIPIEESASACA